MGMDLVPINSKAEGFHANWSGWSFLGGSLRLLGADTRRMSGSNSGDLVDKETALDWARRLQEALDSGHLRVKSVPDGSFFGGERSECSLEEGVPAKRHDDAFFIRRFVDFLERCGRFQQY
eukprot:scaffold10.g2452.t1